MKAGIKTLVRVLFVAFVRAGLKVKYQYERFVFLDAEPDDYRILSALEEAGFNIITASKGEMISTVQMLRKAGLKVNARVSGDIWALHVLEDDWDYYNECVVGNDAVDVSF